MLSAVGFVLCFPRRLYIGGKNAGGGAPAIMLSIFRLAPEIHRLQLSEEYTTSSAQ